MTTEGRDDKDGMDRQDDETLWSLLGRQRPPATVSPFFARRVLREVALAEEARGGGWRGRLARALGTGAFFRRAALWSGVFSGACAVGLFCLSVGVIKPGGGLAPSREEAAVGGLQQPSPVETPLTATRADVDAAKAQDAVPVEEVEVIADLDNILEREESRLWTEDTARF